MLIAANTRRAYSASQHDLFALGFNLDVPGVHVSIHRDFVVLGFHI